MSYAIKLNTAQRYGQNLSLEIRGSLMAYVTAAEIAMKLGVSSRAVEKRIKTLRENGVIRRIGGDKGGYWEVIENGIEQ